MPFKSSAQKGYLFANLPKVAAKFAADTPKGTALPSHVPKAPGGAPTGNSRPTAALSPKNGQTQMVNRITKPQFHAANPNRKTQAL